MRYFQNPIIRWLLTLGWTALAINLLLSPSGDGTTVSQVSKLFGGTEITDAIGHIVISSVLAWLWCWTINVYMDSARVLRFVLIGGLLWSFVAELSQLFVPKRGASLIDLAANIVGVAVGILAYKLMLGLLTRQQQTI